MLNLNTGRFPKCPDLAEPDLASLGQMNSGPINLDVLTSSGPDLSAAQLHDLLLLRVNVFVVEQTCPYPEIDGNDLLATTTHFWLEDHEGVVSGVRVLKDASQWRIGRVVTRESARGHGLTRVLFASALEQFGDAETVLHAQSHLHDFYASLGYIQDGAEFLEDDIPHTPMSRPGQ